MLGWILRATVDDPDSPEAAAGWYTLAECVSVLRKMGQHISELHGAYVKQKK